ncbi:actin-like ATPase domain-containing protein [Vararia minispora EC-137]|uniref:Actin-like ATPase domain-containing protein n=1 Tax=Vararia minispora EC-137 TaxID=1314806 RepID=A0ACB8QNP7_9AGAM|nr:actin-like ATPase domain-containing protein [Vararia minispora EC-137]
MRGLCQRLVLFGALCLSLGFYVAPAAAATVLAIDYGADFMKASLMKPGLPFDILLNKDSKRKIHSSVAWKGEERLFGQDAYSLATRYPKDTYSSLKYLLGVPANADVVSYFANISPVTLVASSRYTLGIPKPGGRTWDIEELVAMQLAYIRQLASDTAGEPVRDVVVTVPPYYTQFERDAIADAVEIAGLKLLTLINDGTAVAINYAMTRSFAEPEHHIIFDSGASSTRATIVAFSADAKGRGTQVQVKSVGYNRLIGGTELTRRLRDILIGDFMKKNGGVDVRQDKKAMARLWKEADRVKGILSANTEATATIESLIDDIDFKTKVLRTQFEAVCKDIEDAFATPLIEALSNTNLSMKDIKSVVLFGGNTRVPMVRRNLEAVVGEGKIAVNVNADEAAVLGAALHGASLSRQFRTKDIKVIDVLPYDVQVAYEAETKATGPGVRPRTIHSIAFPAGSKTGTRKTLSFKRHSDFSLAFQYKSEPAPQFPVEFLEARVEGVAEALTNMSTSGASDLTIKVTIALSESGFVSVPEAIVYADFKDDSSIAGMLKGFFGDKGDKVAEGEVQEPMKEQTPRKPKDVTIPLKVPIKYTSVAPMALENKREARTRLNDMETKELSASMREEQRNGLEGYIYRTRDILEGSQDHPFMQCSQESERTALKQKLEEVAKWFHDHQDTADTKDFIEKRLSIQSIENPIQHRYQEIVDFPEVLNNSQKWNFHTRMFLTEARQNLTEEEKTGTQGKYTIEELNELEQTLREHEAWLHVNVEKQRTVKHNEDPAIETKEMKERADKLELHLKRLVQKKPPRRRATSSASDPSSTAEPSATPPTQADGGEKVHLHEEL